MSDPRALHVAFTLEQCWHRVPGGTAVAALELARALDELGVRVTGVAAWHRRPPAPEWRPSVPMRHLPLPRSALYEGWHRLRRPRVERATGATDLIHATTLAIPPRNAPLVVTMHDLAFLAQPRHFTKRGLSFFKRGLELALKDADLVLCASRATANACLGVGFDESRLRLIPLGVRHQPVTDEDITRVRGRYGLERPYVMWTGTIEPRKNLRGLVAAFALLHEDVDLVIVGPTGWNEDLSSLMTDNLDRVRALGFVPKRDLAALYAGADVFCYPSFLEGFGFPILEAMSQGTPVVTSAGTATEEIAQDAGILVDPREPRTIAEGLSRLLQDESLAKKLGSAGRDRAAQYTWERTATMTARAYEEVAA